MSKTITCVWQGTTNELKTLNSVQANWLKASMFEGKAGQLLAIPSENGEIDQYVFGMGERGNSHPMVTGLAASQLKDGEFDLKGDFDDPNIAALGFRLGGYQFTNFKNSETKVSLGDADGADKSEVALMAEAAELARDLINRPANDLGPENYEIAIREFAKKTRCRCAFNCW